MGAHRDASRPVCTASGPLWVTPLASVTEKEATERLGSDMINKNIPGLGKHDPGGYMLASGEQPVR